MAEDVKTVHISDLRFDDKNANRGTERGDQMLERSLQQYGAGRSILIDKHGNVIAGNKTLGKAGELGFEDVVVVRTDGKKIVAVQRMDLDIDDPRARELAIADNRTSELDLEWDADVLAALQIEGVDLSQFWTDREMEALMAIPEPEDEDESSGMGAGASEPTPMTFMLTPEQADVVTRALSAAKQGLMHASSGPEADAAALAAVCDRYLTNRVSDGRS